MPRTKTHTKDDLIDAALHQFWAHGFSATSMDDLVKATGVSRHGIYSEFPGKAGLFAAIFARYSETVVTPAFAAVESDQADLADIARYFEHQIALAESVGMPGPGCLVGNTATEAAAQSAPVKTAISAHNDRLLMGFSKALKRTTPSLPAQEINDLAEVLVTAATGLWAMSRVIDNAATLRRQAKTLIDLIKRRLGDDGSAN